MRRFRLNLIILIIGISISAAGTALLFYTGRIPFAIISCLLLLVLCGILWILIKKLIHIMQSFASGLEMTDNSMRFDFGRDDAELRETSDTMNRIITIYRTGRLELETRKLYYDRILKIMTHEMRNAISPVISLATDIQKKPEKYKEGNLTETILLIKEQSMEIKRFLDSYYELTHLPTPEKTLISANDFIETIKTGICGLVADIDTEQVVSFVVATNAFLWIDKGMISQAIRNMVKNALEATRYVSNPKITLSLTTSGDHSLITITDNGPGIPPSIMQNLFQPFTSSKQGGSGIGMFISRQIVRLHGGELSARNYPDKGVQIELSLPTPPKN